MSNQVQATTKPKQDIRDLLQSESVLNQIRKVLPKHLTPDRMARVMLTACIKTPKLLQCTRESLLQAMMLCSQAGLEPDGRNAHLIPYGQTVQVIFDWKGLVSLAERNGVQNIYADKVCENDEFKAWVEDGVKKLNHVIDYRKPRVTAYAYYTSCRRNGLLDYEVMTKDEVDAIRKRSRAAMDGPWVTDYDEMAKKTVIRRMSKRWDLSSEVADIINDDDDTPVDITKPKRPAFGDDPFGSLPEVVAPVPEPKNVQEATEQPKEATPKKSAKSEPVPEPAQTDPDGGLGPLTRPEAKTEVPSQSVIPPQALTLAAEVVAFKRAEGETDDGAFGRFDAVVRSLFTASGVTEKQFISFCKKQKLAKDNQNKLTDLSPSKVVSMAKTWSAILPEMFKETA